MSKENSASLLEGLSHSLLIVNNSEIEDDGFLHCLRLYRDKDSGGVRLEAAIASGELKHTPVWTAFSKRSAGGDCKRSGQTKAYSYGSSRITLLDAMVIPETYKITWPPSVCFL